MTRRLIVALAAGLAAVAIDWWATENTRSDIERDNYWRGNA
jgi:hypothetical protein